MSTEPTSAERLRAAALGLKGRSVTVEHGGHRYEVREPSWRVRQQFLEMAGLAAGSAATGEPEGRVEIRRMTQAIAYLAVQCTHDPATGARVFLDEDGDKLLDTPVTGLLQVLAQAAQGMLNEVDATAKK